MNEALARCAACLDSLTRTLDVTTENLVHARTPGWRERLVATADFASNLHQAERRIDGVARAEEIVNHAPGVYVRSDTPYSYAIRGDGFFSVETPAGVRYTRNGQFALDGEGNVVTTAGYRVLDWNGPVRLDGGAGPVTADPDGTLLQGGEPVASLRIVAFADPGRLRPAGDTLFAAPANDPGERAAAPGLAGGLLEYPNAGAIDGLVGLIATQRAFESAQRVMRTIGDSYRTLTSSGN